MTNPVPKEVGEYIESHIGIWKIEKLAEEVDKLYGEKYKRRFNKTFVKNYIVRHKLRNGRPDHGIFARLIPDDQIEYLRSHAEGKSNEAITAEINSVFGTSWKRSQIKTAKRRYHISSGLTGRFEKGNVPWIKGRKIVPTPGSVATQFKKGRIAENKCPVGTLRRRTTGMWRKTEEGWRAESNVVYEAHFGKIPKGTLVLHLNGDCFDNRPENLALAEQGDIGTLNSLGLSSSDSDITRAGLSLVKVVRALSKKGKKVKIGRKK